MRQIKNQRGVALMAVLVAVTILGLMSGIAGPTIKDKVQRAKEKELLWRGNQYRQAIESYYTPPAGKKGVPKVFPSKLEDLIKDPRSTETVRHLRQLYKDPMTGEDWVPIKGPDGRIKGVHSSSEQEPFKQGNFSEENKKFEGKLTYSEWQFVFEPKNKKTGDQNKPAPNPGQQSSGSPSSGSPQANPGAN